jgi:hypothetical protein
VSPDLIVHVEGERHEFTDKPDDGRKWGFDWSPSNTGPDVSCFTRRVGDLIEFEVAIGNTSIVVGNRGATKPAMPGSVTIEPGSEYGIIWELDRAWPTFWPIGREAWRRGVLVPLARRDLVPQAKRIARGIYDDSNSDDFGPCRMPLGKLGAAQRANVMQIDAGRLQGLRTALATGMTFWVDDTDDGVVLIVNGGWRPWGPANPGGVGGSGIQFLTGWRQNPNDLQLAVLAAQCEHERMIRYYRRDTGAVLTVDDYPGPGTSPDLWGSKLPEVLGVPNPDPLPPPYDFAHEIRGTRRTIQVTEQMDSPMAKRSLKGTAAVARLRFSERGRLPIPGYYPLNVASLLQEAKAHPGHGIWGTGPGRNIGWCAFEVAQDIKKTGSATPGQMRFAHDFLLMIDTAAMPSGGLQKGWGLPFPEQVDANGQPIHTTQTMEAVILAHGTYALATAVGLPVPVQVMRLLEGIYGPHTKVQRKPYYGGRGPWHYLNTADANGPLPEFEAGFGWGANTLGDATHAEAACALAHHITKDPAWLDRGALYNTEYGSWQQKMAALTAPGATVIDWQAGLLGQMQSVTP